MKKKIIAITLCLLLFAGVSNTASALSFEQYTKIGTQTTIPAYGRVLSIPPLQQEHENWCWAAVAKMAGEFVNKRINDGVERTVTQSSIVTGHRKPSSKCLIR